MTTLPFTLPTAPPAGPLRLVVTLRREGDQPRLDTVVGQVLDQLEGTGLDLARVAALAPTVRPCQAGEPSSITVELREVQL